MKQKLFMLSFLAAVAITAVVGKKTFGSHENECGTLLMQNVEALSQTESTIRYVIVEREVTREETVTETVTYPDGTTRTVTKTVKTTENVKQCIVSENGPLTVCNV